MREVLAAEMLEALGVPTSRAFSLIETGEALERGDEPSPTRSAVLTRLGHSHIRFGSFQRHLALGNPEMQTALRGYQNGALIHALQRAGRRNAATREPRASAPGDTPIAEDGSSDLDSGALVAARPNRLCRQPSVRARHGAGLASGGACAS